MACLPRTAQRSNSGNNVDWHLSGKFSVTMLGKKLRNSDKLWPNWNEEFKNWAVSSLTSDVCSKKKLLVLPFWKRNKDVSIQSSPMFSLNLIKNDWKGRAHVEREMQPSCKEIPSVMTCKWVLVPVLHCALWNRKKNRFDAMFASVAPTVVRTSLAFEQSYRNI